MKNLIFIAGLIFAVPAVAADEAPKTKKICVMQKDAKTGKEKEVCKNVKVHKKHEGTQVEGTKPENKK